jgi:hypothetical protein
MVSGSVANAFVSPGSAARPVQPQPGCWTLPPMVQQQQHQRSISNTRSSSSSTELHMFMGSDGGILGIGTPELVRRWIYIIIYIYDIFCLSVGRKWTCIFFHYFRFWLPSQKSVPSILTFCFCFVCLFILFPNLLLLLFIFSSQFCW